MKRILQKNLLVHIKDTQNTAWLFGVIFLKIVLGLLMMILLELKRQNSLKKTHIVDQEGIYQFILKDDNTFTLDLESGDFVGIMYANGWFKGDNIFYMKDIMGVKQIEEFYVVKQ